MFEGYLVMDEIIELLKNVWFAEMSFGDKGTSNQIIPSASEDL
jgi:hypothetical protein